MKILDINPRAGGSVCAIKKINSRHKVWVVEPSPLHVKTILYNDDVAVIPMDRFSTTLKSSWDIVTCRYAKQYEVGLHLLARETRPKAIILEIDKPNKDMRESIIRFKAYLRTLGYFALTMSIDTKKYGIALEDKVQLVVCTTPSAGDIQYPIPKPRGGWVTLQKAWEKVPEDNAEVFHPHLQSWFGFVPEGGSIADLPLRVQEEYYEISGLKTNIRNTLIRLSMSKQVKKLPVNPVSLQTPICHPKLTRPPTIREYARIKGFPDDWMFSGGLLAQYKQIATSSSPVILEQFYRPIFEAVERLK